MTKALCPLFYFPSGFCFVLFCFFFFAFVLARLVCLALHESLCWGTWRSALDKQSQGNNENPRPSGKQEDKTVGARARAAQPDEARGHGAALAKKTETMDALYLWNFGWQTCQVDKSPSV